MKCAECEGSGYVRPAGGSLSPDDCPKCRGTGVEPPEASTYRAKLERLLFDLWRDGVMSEQQCAKYAGTSLVGMRQALDCQAVLHGYGNREDAQA